MLDHKRINFGSPTIKIESQIDDSENTVTANKRNQLHDKYNAENLSHHHQQLTNTEKLSSKHVDIKSTDKPCGPINNILFEKNQIETTNRVKTSPVKTKRKLNLEEYLRRRPDLKVNSSKVSEIKQEPIDWGTNPTDAERKEESPATTIQDLYEEIIVVSIGSNTDVTIPVNERLSGDNQSLKLMSEITDTIAKVKNDAGEHIASNTLIASIRDVIIKKSSSLNCSSINANSNTTDSTTNDEIVKEELEHGEDKTIMHLKKDRVRNARTSIGVQTDCDIRFPALERPKTLIYSKSLSRSPSTSSRSSYSSYSSDNRKSKFLFFVDRKYMLKLTDVIFCFQI